MSYIQPVCTAADKITSFTTKTVAAALKSKAGSALGALNVTCKKGTLARDVQELYRQFHVLRRKKRYVGYNSSEEIYKYIRKKAKEVVARYSAAYFIKPPYGYFDADIPLLQKDYSSDFRNKYLRYIESFFPYHIDGFECFKCCGISGYDTQLLVKDLSRMFKYLPESEIHRMIISIFMCYIEALKHSGKISIPFLGDMTVQSNTIPKHIHDKRIIYKPDGTSYNCAKFFRTVVLRPSNYLRCLVNPTHRDYFNSLAVSKRFGGSLLSAVEHLKTHYNIWKILLQDVYDKDFVFLGYTDEYYEMINHPIMRDTFTYHDFKPYRKVADAENYNYVIDKEYYNEEKRLYNYIEKYKKLY